MRVSHPVLHSMKVRSFSVGGKVGKPLICPFGPFKNMTMRFNKQIDWLLMNESLYAYLLFNSASKSACETLEGKYLVNSFAITPAYREKLALSKLISIHSYN